MKEENKKEEIQSRREFFKEAAKKGLPIVAAIALAGMPAISKAESEPTGCSGCIGDCYGHCNTGCYTGCKDTCLYGCETHCKGGCRGTCSGTCAGGCRSNNKYN